MGSASGALQVRPIRGVGNLLVRGRSITMFSAASAIDDALFTGRWLAIRFMIRFHRWAVDAVRAFVADTLPSDIRLGPRAFRLARHGLAGPAKISGSRPDPADVTCVRVGGSGRADLSMRGVGCFPPIL